MILKGGTIVTIPTIKVVIMVDEVVVIAVITFAFSTDPVARWAYPDPQQYFTAMPLLVKAFSGKAVAQGSAYYVDGYAGAALWLPPDVHPNDEELIAVVERNVAEGEKRDLLFAFFEQMGTYHPKEPHWYLPLIGVEAIHQGHGYGSALMEHALRPCDRNQTLAYLESSNPRN